MRIAAFLTILLIALPAVADVYMFDTEQAAEQHCPGSGIVWMNPQIKAYHFKGNPKYGKTKGGGYACQPEADAAGYRSAH